MAELQPVRTVTAPEARAQRMATGPAARYAPVTQKTVTALVAHIAAAAWDTWDDEGHTTIAVRLDDAEAAVRKALGIEPG